MGNFNFQDCCCKEDPKQTEKIKDPAGRMRSNLSEQANQPPRSAIPNDNGEEKEEDKSNPPKTK